VYKAFKKRMSTKDPKPALVDAVNSNCDVTENIEETSKKSSSQGIASKRSSTEKQCLPMIKKQKAECNDLTECQAESSKATDLKENFKANEGNGMPMGGKRCQPKTVNTRLQKLGIDPEKVSSCVKSAMSKGHIILTGEATDLEKLVIADEYMDHQFKIYVKDILYQQDYAGIDYEEDSSEAPAVCICCNAENADYPQHVYVTRLCSGKPSLDSGKFHNHCTECKGFGKCIGDYRNSHCGSCNNHYFAGNYGFPCQYCERRGGSGEREDCVIS